MIYRTILADPPWPQPLTGKRKRSKGGVRPALSALLIPGIVNLEAANETHGAK